MRPTPKDLKLEGNVGVAAAPRENFGGGTVGRLEVLMLCPELHRYVGRRNSDVRTYALLKSLEERFRLNLRMCGSWWVWTVANATYAFNSLLSRNAVTRPLARAKLWIAARRLVWLPRRALRKARADVIYSIMLFPMNRVDVPIVLEVDFNPWGIPAIREQVDVARYVPRWMVERASVLILRHEVSLEALRQRFPDRVDRAIVVPSYLPECEPIAVEAIQAKFEKFGCPTVKLLFVGNLARAKGLPELVEVYNRLRRSYSVEFTVVSRFDDGGVALPPGVRAFSNIPCASVYELMAESHIFAMPTKHDSHGRVFWEAMANGCALLAPCFTPHPELFGAYGLTADPTSVDDVCRQLERMLQDANFCLERALLGRKHFIERHHHTVSAARYIEAFERAAASRDAVRVVSGSTRISGATVE